MKEVTGIMKTEEKERTETTMATTLPIMTTATDWEAKHLVMITTSGVKHKSFAGSDATNEVQFYQSSTCAYELTPHNPGDGSPEFLSLKAFDLVQEPSDKRNEYYDRTAIWSVINFKEQAAKGEPLHIVQRSIVGNRTSGKFQLRIYKDRKMTLLVEEHNKDTGEVHWYTFLPNRSAMHRDKLLYADLNGTETGKAVNFKEVGSNQEVYESRFTPSQENTKLLKYIFANRCDIRTQPLPRYGSTFIYKINKETHTQLIDFFELKDEDSEVGKTCNVILGLLHSSIEDMSYWTIKEVFNFMIKKDTRKMMKGRQEIVDHILETVKEEIKHHTIKKLLGEGTGITLWGRVDDYIYCYNMRGISCSLFIYDVKKKSALLADFDGRESEEDWKYSNFLFQIPGYDKITDRLILTTDNYEEPEPKDKWTPKYRQFIQRDMDFDKIFAGTAVEYCAKNIDKSTMFLKSNREVFHKEEVYTFGKYTIKVDEMKKSGGYHRWVPCNFFDDLSNDFIGYTAIAILCTAKETLAEQLMKSGLTNLYCGYLEQKMTGWDKHYYMLDKTNFEEATKEVFEPTTTYWNDARYGTLCLKTGKNLKQITGFGMHILRRLNEVAIIQANNYLYLPPYGGAREDHVGVFRVIPAISYAAGVLEIKDINSVDKNTLNQIIEESIRTSTDYYGNTIKTNDTWPKMVRVKRALKRYGEEKVESKTMMSIVREYKNDPDIYSDYLNIRSQLKKLQDKLISEGKSERIYSEKEYSLTPDSCKKFFPFIEGGRVLSKSMYGERFVRCNGETTFKDNLSERFKAERNSGLAKFIYTEEHKLLGFSVKMTELQHMKYLHDEGSYWIGFYQDKAKEAGFQGAIERIKPLAWKDPKEELEIVIPTSVRDITNEGSTLDHCVASYVDPIIGGTENIVFLRRQDMEDKPFFTIEVLPNGNIRQIHCFKNGDPTILGQREAYAGSKMECYNKTFDILGFLKRWITAKNKEAGKTVLCSESIKKTL